MSLARCAAALVLIARICTSQDPAPFQVDVKLVPVTVSITDKNGHPLRGIKVNELKLLDNGRPREIQYFSEEHDVPLTVGVIIDVSGSQHPFFSQHFRNVKQFVKQVLHSGDRAFLLAIRADVHLVTDLTPSVENFLAGLDRLEANTLAGVQFGDPCPKFSIGLGGNHCVASAIWNSVFSAAQLKLKTVEGRKALILLSDGIDTGSQHSLTNTIEASQGADALVYTLASKFLPFGWATPPSVIQMRATSNLRRLAEETGGGAYNAKGDSSRIFADIEADLRNLYVLGFQVPEKDRDGNFHEIKISSTRPGAHIRARKGYVSVP
jgi:Ca-activated chloride channel family protein